MSEHDEGILCHCGHGSGHTPGEPGCDAPTIRPGRHLRPEITRASDGPYGINWTQAKASGTCPVCRKPGVRVQRLQVFASHVRGRRQEPEINPAKPRGSVLEVRPGMAPHKVGGVECKGTGQVPAETRYTPGRELASHLHVLAEE